MDKWIASFINTHSVRFSAHSDEMTDMNMLEYIAYCLDADCILIKLEKVDN